VPSPKATSKRAAGDAWLLTLGTPPNLVYARLTHRSCIIAFVALAACSKPKVESRPEVVDASAAAAASSLAREPDDAAIAQPTLVVPPIVTQWNDAHVARDANALQTLYADTVYFYGKSVPRAECVKRKAAAFAKAPDYSQAVRDVVATQRGDRLVIAFVKASTTGGKTTDFPSVLYVDAQGHITAEMDKPVNDTWCLGPTGENSVVIPPFTISAAQAAAHLLHSRYVKNPKLVGGNATPDATMYRCPDPTECPSGVVRSGPPRTKEEESCYFNVRLGVSDPGFAKLGNGRTHQWLDLETWIDGASNVHWYQDIFSDTPDVWQSDP
jgi:hypothetical protein